MGETTRRAQLAIVAIGGAAHLAAAEPCPSDTVEGVDVYSGDGTIDWATLKGSGRAFAFIKATQGTYDVQDTFADDWTGAGSAGILRSPYHFFDATDDGSAQAAAFLAEIGSAGYGSGDLPPLLDLECPTASDQTQTDASCEYAGSSGWVPTATLSQRVFDFLQAVEQATGRVPLVYSYPDWFANVGFTDSALASYPLFIASYTTCPAVPAPWGSAVFWQYSATADIPGVGSSADADRFIGTLAELESLTVPPVGADVGGADVGLSEPRGGGCGCATTPDTGALAGGALVAAAVLRRPRRRCHRTAALNATVSAGLSVR
jgi:lysozyme